MIAKCKHFIFQTFIFKLLFIFINSECDRSTPIRFNGGECELKFCTVEEYKSGKCVIDNEIAKTQYLNEITILDSGNENSKFDLVKFANGSLVSTISYSINSESYIKFYALSSNEQRFFLEKYEKEIIEENKNNGKEEDKENNVDNGDDNKDEDNNQGNDNENKTVYKTEYYESIRIKNSGNFLYDHKLFISRNYLNEEFLISSCNDNTYFFEIYDLYSKTIDKYDYKQVFYNDDNNHLSIKNKGYPTIIEIKENYTYYNTIFGALFSENDSTYYFALYKINIGYEESMPKIEKISKSENNFLVSSSFDDINCYNIKDKKIICLLYGEDNKMKIIAFDYELKDEAEEEIVNSNIQTNLFKCIHIKNNIGSFIYLTKEDNDFYLNIIFKDYNIASNSFSNYFNFTEEKYKIYFNDFTYKNNDFIKYSENKICFITKANNNMNNKNMNVYLMNLYEEEPFVVIREYNIDLDKLYNLNFCDKISSIIFNNNIGIAFNLYDISNGENKYKIALLFFGHIEKIHEIFDIEKYLSDSNLNNDSNSYNVIDINSLYKIKNNIFGYEFDKTKIIRLTNCDDIKFYSSKNESIEITNNYQLEKDENMKFYYLPKINNPLGCYIEFSFIVIEPELTIFDKYPNNKQGSETEESFNTHREKYTGITSNYTIYMEKGTTTQCHDNCTSCLKYNIDECKEYKVENLNETNSTNKVFNSTNKVFESQDGLNQFLDEMNINDAKSMIANLDSIMDKINPDLSYVIKQEDISLIIKKSHEYVEESTVNINFLECEKRLRKNLPENTELRIVQLNIVQKDEKSLTDQVEYKVYDENNKVIDLSPCSDIIIPIEYELTDLSSLDLENILKFADLGVDVFNIKDEFFNDICRPYSDSDANSDMVLSDRVSDIYQNFSVCGDGCEYSSFNIESLSFNCDCKVKQEMSAEPEKGNFAESITGAFLYSNFGAIKCYKLFFSLEGKLDNIGFWIISSMILGHIPIYILYFLNKINPIKNFLKKEMENKGYIDNIENKIESQEEIINYSTTEKEKFQPDIFKKRKNIRKSKKRKKKEEDNNINNNINNKNNNNYPPKKVKEIDLEKFQNAKEKGILNVNNKKNKKYIIFNKRKINNLIAESKENEVLNLNSLKTSTNGSIKNKEVTNSESLKNKEITRTGSFKNKDEIEKDKIKEIKKDNEEHLIIINAQNTNKYIPPTSNYNLNNYTYEEAIIYEKRSYPKIFFIFLMSTEKVLNTFVYKQPLELKPLRISMFLFNLSCDISLNAFFYLSDNISDKYHYEGSNQFLFSLTNNIVISLVSTVISFILIFFFQSLSQSTEKITKIFKNEEDLMKENKEYKVDKNKKNQIIKEIEKILRCLKIKIIIFFITEMLVLLFFLYYVTLFCQVYKSTQVSWIYDILVSYALSLLIAIIISLICSFLYLISYKKKIKFLYKISLFIYDNA